MITGAPSIVFLYKWNMSVMYRLATIRTDDCCLLYLKINQDVDNRRKSAYAVQLQLCRSMLALAPLRGSLTSPQRDTTQIAVVGLKCVLEDPQHEFRTWLQDQHINVISCSSIDPYAIEECVRFSLSFWMETQHWYRVGDCLVQGGFLNGHTTNLSKIRYEVHSASSGEVFLRIFSETVRMFILEQWQLIGENSKTTVAIEPRWAYCLPKLGRGRVVAIHRTLPAHSPFSSYKEMRSYWKNCHGYDLPAGEPEVYYDVLFNGFKEPLLYPFFCVLSNEPEAICFRDSREAVECALSAFTTSLAAEPRQLCGQLMKFSDVSPEECRLRASLLATSVVNKKKSSVKKGQYRPSFAVVDKPKPVQEERMYVPPTSKVRISSVDDEPRVRSYSNGFAGDVEQSRSSVSTISPAVPTRRFLPSFGGSDVRVRAVGKQTVPSVKANPVLKKPPVASKKRSIPTVDLVCPAPGAVRKTVPPSKRSSTSSVQAGTSAKVARGRKSNKLLVE